jgi:hypothetical protein
MWFAFKVDFTESIRAGYIDVNEPVDNAAGFV